MLIGRYIIGIPSRGHSVVVGCVFAIKRILRYLVVQTQVLLGIRRNTTIPFHKGGQWVSITRGLIDYLLEQEERAFTIFSRTFGADEYFRPNSYLGYSLYGASL